MQRMTVPFPNNIYKNNSKGIKDLNARLTIIKHLEENIGQKLHDIRFCNDFLDMTAKSHVTKEKINKLDFMKINKFCASKALSTE